MKELRESIMSEEEIIAARRRFALFSQPPPIAVGDDGQYRKTQHKRGQDGKPITKPRNMLAGPIKLVLLNHHTFMFQKVFMLRILILTPIKEIQNNSIKCIHVQHFTKYNLNQAQVQKHSKSSYEYQQQKQQRKKFPQKNQAGRVITKQRNIITNPISKVEHQFMKAPKHILDPYQRKKQLERKQQQLNKKKMGPQIFKSMSYGDKPFLKQSLTYGEDQKSKSILKQKNKHTKSLMKTVQHEAAFKPARRGHGDPLGRYPEFMPKKSQTIEQLPRKKFEKKDADQQSWKPNGSYLSRPTPSISLNPKNIGFKYRK